MIGNDGRGMGIHDLIVSEDSPALPRAYERCLRFFFLCQ